MNHYYLLWAVGPDRPGIVANVSHALFQKGCNLEDSSMMRLGSEFGILLIFTSKTILSQDLISKLEISSHLAVGIKKISRAEALFKTPKKGFCLIAVHGADRKGLVYRVTDFLAKQRFNITDLSTHRTSARGGRPGYILFIEGETSSQKKLPLLEKQLTRLAARLGVRITLQRIDATPL